MLYNIFGIILLFNTTKYSTINRYLHIIRRFDNICISSISLINVFNLHDVLIIMCCIYKQITCPIVPRNEKSFHDESCWIKR